MHDQANYGINWKDLIIKIVLLVLFLLLLWKIIPNPDLNTFYDAVYNNNLQTMKDAARNHYTVDRLPEEIGDSEKMTLQEMENNHMLIPFVDKNNEYCDKVDSFVQVTKTGEQEFILKIQLHCGTQVDYVLDTIGCYDVCVGKECEEQEVEQPTKKPVVNKPSKPVQKQKVLQYQLKKGTQILKTTYTCPEGYTLSGNKCYKGATTEKKNATPIYSDKNTTVTDAATKQGPSSKTYTNSVKKSSVSGYSCPNGGSLSGSTCVKSSSSSYGATPHYTTGYGSWYVVTTYKRTYAMSPYSNATEQLVSNGTSREYTCGNPINCPTKVTYYHYTLYRRGTTSSLSHYSCPNGGSLSGSTCYTTSSANYAATPSYSTTYSCPSGYTAEGSGASLKCYKTVAGAVTYYCVDKDAELKNKKCYKTTDSKLIGYSCPDGWKLDGKTCIKLIEYGAIKATKTTKKETYYAYKWSYKNCEDGWEFTGKTRYIYKTK